MEKYAAVFFALMLFAGLSVAYPLQARPITAAMGYGPEGMEEADAMPPEASLSEGNEGDLPEDSEKEIVRPSPVAGCTPDGYVGRRVLREGEAKTPGSDTIDPDELKKPYRILLPDSMVTMDYNPARLNLIIDETTRIVKRATCK